MKNALFFSLFFILVGFISCEKQEIPGKIKGMGDTPGQLEIEKQYELPQGILVVGDITGVESISKTEDSKLVFEAKGSASYFGSGRYVRLQIKLLNTSNISRTIFFPKGLLFQCMTGNTQHALLCQTTWFSLKPNSSRIVWLDLYCVNESLHSPNSNSTYKILGVSSSPIIGKLLNLIGWKKVNYEMIFGTWGGGKGTTEGPSYEEITENLQTIIWNLTDNGLDITNEDKEFLESIPELNASEIPIVDTNSHFPEYFEEFVIPGK